jgi:hypothetical protein
MLDQQDWMMLALSVVVIGVDIFYIFIFRNKKSSFENYKRERLRSIGQMD